MNISLLVYDISLIGGAEKVAINLANEFKKANNISIISLFFEKKDRYSDVPGLEIISKKKESITLHFFSYSKKIRNILKENNTDFLIAITAGVVTLAVNAVIGLNTKIIYSEHSNLKNKIYGRKHLFRQYFGAKRSDMIVTLTGQDRKNFINEFGISPKKVISIPNWFTPCNVDSCYAYESKKIISVGRLEYVKGFDYLIEVAKLVSAFHPDWSWDIYGEGSLHHSLQNEINKEGLSDFLFLKGSAECMDNIYNKYSFLVMTSRFEGFPLTLLEAKSHNLPIISFDCPTGPAEIISENENGLLIPAYDVEKMSSGICLLIEDEVLRAKFADNARLGLECYDKKIVMKRWNEVFELLNKEDVDL